MSNTKPVPSVTVAHAQTGRSTTCKLDMRAMQERTYEKWNEPYFFIKSPPASGKSRALMFIAPGKLHTQGLKQAIAAVDIYIHRRFRNDTERLGKQFDMYTKLTTEMHTNA